MCGICGIYTMYGAKKVDDNIISHMMQYLEHRGPDDAGKYVEAEIGLGFRRLSILDLAGGNQPLSNETGDIWLVFNGEIWNYASLRTELQRRGHQFRSQGDSEVIVHAYEEYGTACFTHLHGMFALAIWDRRHRHVLLARDRAGKKPLYYSRVGGDLIFASEIKALFSDPRVCREVELQSLADFLSVRYVPGPQTLFKGILKVRPGHWLLCGRGIWQEECYWNFSFAPLEQRQPYPTSTYLQGIRQHIRRAVEERMMSDVPVGAFLSGGVDSSIIVGQMSQCSKRPVHTFAVGFDVPGYSELSYARQVSTHFGTYHHELLITGADLPRYWSLLTWHRDEPVSEPSDLGVYLMSCLARQYVKVVLSGEGGDELFAGYPKYALDGFARYYHLLPALLRRRLVPSLVERLPYGLRRLQLAVSSLAEAAPQRWVNWFGTFHPSLKEQLLLPSFRGQVDMDASRLFKSQLNLQRDDLSRMLYIDSHFWLPDNLLMKNDKMSMAASLESRTPLLDEHLTIYASTIPSHLKVHGWRTKYILKRAYADFLPSTILERRKMGFNVPTGTWFRQQHSLLSNLLLSEQARDRGLFDYACVERLLQDHFDGRRNYQAQIFLLASLEYWFRVFLDPPVLQMPQEKQGEGYVHYGIIKY